MADEAVIVELLGDPKGCPIQYNCAATDNFPKGAILLLGDNRDADLSAAPNDICAGICAMEKVPTVGTLLGATTVTAYTNGIFDLQEDNTGAIDVGERVKINDANQIIAAVNNDCELGRTFGHALATFAKNGKEAVRVLVGKHV